MAIEFLASSGFGRGGFGFFGVWVVRLCCLLGGFLGLGFRSQLNSLHAHVHNTLGQQLRQAPHKTFPRFFPSHNTVQVQFLSSDTSPVVAAGAVHGKVEFTKPRCNIVTQSTQAKGVRGAS